MRSCPMYNGQNLNFTGKANPYGLIQMGGKRKTKRRKVMRKKRRGTRKHRR